MLKITKTEPSFLAIDENAHVLARYASICQVLLFSVEHENASMLMLLLVEKRIGADR